MGGGAEGLDGFPLPRAGETEEYPLAMRFEFIRKIPARTAVTARGGTGLDWNSGLNQFVRGEALRRSVAACVMGILLITCNGCSLLHFNLGGDPMPEHSRILRNQTREFASVFSSRVARLADSIVARADDPKIRAEAIRWKLGATAAIHQAALRSDPMLALVDAWAVCRQMRGFFQADHEEFGAEQAALVKTAGELETEMSRMARRILSSDEFTRASSFVERHGTAHPLRSLAFERDSISLDWLADDSGMPPAGVGNMAEAIADLSDRVSVFSQQLPLEIRWRIDLERAELEPLFKDVNQLSASAGAALASVPALAENARVLAENAKELTRVTAQIPQTLAPELTRFDQEWKATLATLQKEREAVMLAVKEERIAVVQTLESQRESLVRDFARERAEISLAADRLAQNAIREVGEQARGLVRAVLVYLILLVVVVLGLPFLSGYWVGRAVRRRREPTDQRGPA